MVSRAWGIISEAKRIRCSMELTPSWPAENANNDETSARADRLYAPGNVLRNVNAAMLDVAWYSSVTIVSERLDYSCFGGRTDFPTARQSDRTRIYCMYVLELIQYIRRVYTRKERGTEKKRERERENTLFAMMIYLCRISPRARMSKKDTSEIHTRSYRIICMRG